MSSTAVALDTDRLAWYRRATPFAFTFIVTCALLAAVVYKLRIDGIFACPAGGYGKNAYLSDCTARNYGDYDHGAFWFGLERTAQRAAAEADVLLIGNSRLQFALSGEPTRRWFATPRASYYMLGFSNSETVAFFEPLLARLRPRARAYVINVDRIFDDRVSPPTEQILQGHDVAQRYAEKQSWQGVHRAVCSHLAFLCGQSVAVYRERDNGTWTRLGAAPLARTAVSDGGPRNAERWNRYGAMAERFVAQLPVDRRCVILTLVPTVEAKRAEAAAIAAQLGLELVSPQVEGLHTFDGSHLDEPSAARWSAAFLEQAGPRIRQCLADAPPAGR
jgi:hypothetical protein